MDQTERVAEQRRELVAIASSMLAGETNLIKLTKELFIYESDTGATRPASFPLVHGLENAAVWEAEHVEDRLRDYLAGKPNQWVEQLKPLSN